MIFSYGQGYSFCQGNRRGRWQRRGRQGNDISSPEICPSSLKIINMWDFLKAVIIHTCQVGKVQKRDILRETIP